MCKIPMIKMKTMTSINSNSVFEIFMNKKRDIYTTCCYLILLTLMTGCTGRKYAYYEATSPMQFPALSIQCNNVNLFLLLTKDDGNVDNMWLDIDSYNKGGLHGWKVDKTGNVLTLRKDDRYEKLFGDSYGDIVKWYGGEDCHIGKIQYVRIIDDNNLELEYVDDFEQVLNLRFIKKGNIRVKSVSQLDNKRYYE